MRGRWPRGLPLSLAIAALAALLLALMIASLQAQMLFPAHAVGPAQPVPAAAEKLQLRTDGGDDLHGLHIPPAGRGQPPARPRVRRQCVERVGRRALSPRALSRRRTSSPSTIAAIGPRPAARRPRRCLPMRLWFTTSRSSGSTRGAQSRSASASAAASPPAWRPDGSSTGVILVTPFDSLKAVAASLFPWLPVGAFFAHEIDAAGRACAVSTVPIAIVAAEHDEIIPAGPDRTRCGARSEPGLRPDHRRRRAQRHLPAPRVRSGNARSACSKCLQERVNNPKSRKVVPLLFS